MPNDTSSESVKQKPVQNGPESEPIHTPTTPPDNPPAPPAQPVTNQEVKDAVEAIDDRVKRAEWLMIGLTAGIVLLTLGLVIVGILQWRVMSGQLGEMKSASGQTDKLIEKTRVLAENAGKQADRTKDLADWMKDQADRTRTIAEQAVIQARAANTSADAAIKTAQIGQQQLDTSQRPWITEVTQIATPIEFNVNGMRITFLFTLDNIGHSPAENVWVDAKLINTIVNTPSVAEHQRLCNGPTSGTLGETLFPGKPFSWAWSWTIPWNEIQGTIAPNLLGPLLYGCIEYNYGLSTTRHSTPFRYAVFQADGRLLVQDGGFNISTKGTPPSMLLLRREGVFGQPS